MINQTASYITDVADRSPDRGTTGQVSCGNSSAALVLAANATRRCALLTNHSATIDVYFGFTSGITSSTGHKLGAGLSASIPCTATVYVIAASSTVTVSASEVYD